MSCWIQFTEYVVGFLHLHLCFWNKWSCFLPQCLGLLVPQLKLSSPCSLSAWFLLSVLSSEVIFSVVTHCLYCLIFLPFLSCAYIFLFCFPQVTHHSLNCFLPCFFLPFLPPFFLSSLPPFSIFLSSPKECKLQEGSMCLVTPPSWPSHVCASQTPHTPRRQKCRGTEWALITTCVVLSNLLKLDQFSSPVGKMGKITPTWHNSLKD